MAEKVLIEHGEYLKKGTVVQGVIKNLKESEVILENDTAIPFDFLVLATGAKINSALNYPSRAEKIAWFKEREYRTLLAGQQLSSNQPYPLTASTKRNCLVSCARGRS